jgi:hypothetical protein
LIQLSNLPFKHSGTQLWAVFGVEMQGIGKIDAYHEISGVLFPNIMP